jgi:allophanate hydrolase
LLSLADLYHRGEAVNISAPGCVSIAVVGAHLSGQPLNWQLTQRGARLIKTCQTAPGYRLYALDGTIPPKPGLVRDPGFIGEGIEVEVWAVPEDQLGGFVAAVPPPLGIGSATLDTGEVVKCFICEGYAIARATEITQFGGWRSYLAGRGSRG